MRLAHSLAGAAGTFGFPAISGRASALETLLVE
ncbi:Hpt domain-containing protein [Mesorhizobium sp. M4B.F.Ca.ET.058.02.1.1]|nr:Hpt domain-containing protein [Mesorhizobium sp. M4B.F.Ca.ET.058.02.1.1]